METYQAYRMNDYGWIQTYKDKMGVDDFKKYVNEIYEMLLNMKPGDKFPIDRNVKQENIELFIKIVCLFISEGNDNYDFTNDYKVVRCHGKDENGKKAVDKRRQKLPAGESQNNANRRNCNEAGEDTEGGKVIPSLSTQMAPTG